jgi:hypothetical protein
VGCARPAKWWHIDIGCVCHQAKPIEQLFNWLIAKTDVKRAGKARSANGLSVLVFGEIAAAFIYLINH